MSYGQAATTGFINQQLGSPLPPPPESMTQVLDQTLEKVALIENQVDEVVGRLFNIPRVDQSNNEKPPHVPSASERVLELRSRAIRINQALATILEKL